MSRQQLEDIILEIENKIEHLYDGVEKCFDIMERFELEIMDIKRTLENENGTP